MLLFNARKDDRELTQRFMPLVRSVIQKVVISKTPGHQPARLEVHGHIAGVMAAMDAATAMEKPFQVEKHNEYL